METYVGPRGKINVINLQLAENGVLHDLLGKVEPHEDLYECPKGEQGNIYASILDIRLDTEIFLIC